MTERDDYSSMDDEVQDYSYKARGLVAHVYNRLLPGLWEWASLTVAERTEQRERLLPVIDATLSELDAQQAEGDASLLPEGMFPVRWVHCSPAFCHERGGCNDYPRRVCACVPENGGHDHALHI